ncbi:GGDEF domain-containing protein [Peloplasma aerotolerans]|uniref:GGDEF domain-containing protein n=1 Tax=Peloplasma aerotolerans TaxID=3044389 RepID=A0AAW6U9V7_9MOLU|nr:GGDEF domain-containing protein [Mariniplasma sp. M4Ah]MDI6452439.1 GGDEF domain-containing protein [Mariniplasma sp. M4Ah]
MGVFLKIDINLISIFMLSLVFLIAYRRLDRSDTLNRLYLYTVVAIIFGLLIEAATVVMNGVNIPWLIFVNNGFHAVLFIVAPILSCLWYFLLRNFISVKVKVTKQQKILLFIPVALNLVLSLLSPFFDFYFNISQTNVYARGSWFMISIIIIYFYLILGIIHVITHRKNIITTEYYLLIAFGFLPIMGGIGQGLIYGILLMWSSAAFALIIVYIYLQERLIHLDNLTGAWTRKSFIYYMNKKLNQRKIEPFGGIYFDIDDLKKINDNYGHLEGDFAISEIVKRVKGIMYDGEIIARLGGDEFVIITNDNSEKRLKSLAEDIDFSLSVFNENSDKAYQLSCSYGTGVFNDEFKSVDQFLRYIDYKMYLNKKNNH